MTGQLKKWYSLPAAAELLDMKPKTARRFLRAHGVELPVGKGRRARIPLTVLLKKIGDHLESAAFAQQIERAGGEKEGQRRPKKATDGGPEDHG